MSSGVLTDEMFVADLFDFCTNRHKGREDDDEVSIYKNVGALTLT
jgi:ornithine cyclodeaminase/alanine dehydrogenase-like protein (mu-crystallin family)